MSDTPTRKNIFMASGPKIEGVSTTCWYLYAIRPANTYGPINDEVKSALVKQIEAGNQEVFDKHCLGVIFEEETSSYPDTKSCVWHSREGHTYEIWEDSDGALVYKSAPVWKMDPSMSAWEDLEDAYRSLVDFLEEERNIVEYVPEEYCHAHEEWHAAPAYLS